PCELRARALVEEVLVFAAALLDMKIERVVTRVDYATSEPAIEGSVRVIEDAIPSPVPVHRAGRFGPESFRVFLPAGVSFVVGRGHGVARPHGGRLSLAQRFSAGNPGRTRDPRWSRVNYNFKPFLLT